MIRKLLVTLSLLLATSAHAATMLTYPDTATLARINPFGIHTNVYVEASSAFFTFDASSAVATNEYTIKPVNHNGRWIRNTMYKTLFDFGASKNGGDITTVISNLPNYLAVVVPYTENPFTITTSTNVNKHLRLHFEDGATIQHADDATGHMIHMDGGSIVLTGRGIIDGNKDGQSHKTNNYFATIYGCNPIVQDITFTNTVRHAYLDFESTTIVFFERVKAYNAYQMADTEKRANSFFTVAPGQADYKPFVYFRDIYMENAEKSNATDRYSGGIYCAGADINDSQLRVSITGVRAVRVGDDVIITDVDGTAHYGIPVIDIYEDFEYVFISDFFSTNGNYMGLKIQNAANVIIKDAFIHTEGVTAMVYTPGERSQTSPYWNGRFENITIDMNGNTTGNGFVINAGDAGGFRNMSAENITITNTYRGIVIEGYKNDGSIDTYDSTINFSKMDVRTDGHSALQVYGYYGDLKIYQSRFESTNSGSGFIMTQTNSLARVELVGCTFRGWDTGWGARIHGVSELVVTACTFQSGTGEAVELQDNTEGENILILKWDDNNIIRGGSVDVVTADIDAGYFANNGTYTYFPTGATDTRGNGTASYFQTLRLDYAGAMLAQRYDNQTAAGALAVNFRSQDSSGTIYIYDDTYTDADKADRFSLTAESTASGVDVDSTGASATVRIRARGASGAIQFATGSTTVDGTMSGTTFNWLGSLLQTPDTISATDIDWSTGNTFSKSISGNTTFTFSNATSGQWITVQVINTGSFTVTWPTVTWKDGSTPTQTASKSDFYTFYYNGTTYYGSASQNY